MTEPARTAIDARGVIPGYALLPRGGLCATTYFHKALTGWARSYELAFERIGTWRRFAPSPAGRERAG